MDLSDALISLREGNLRLGSNILNEDFAFFLFEDEESLEGAHVFNHFATVKDTANLAHIDRHIAANINDYPEKEKHKFVLSHMLENNPGFLKGLKDSVKEYAEREDKPSKFHISLNTHALPGNLSIKRKVFQHTVNMSKDDISRLLEAHSQGEDAVIAHFKDELAPTKLNAAGKINATGPMHKRQSQVIARAFTVGRNIDPVVSSASEKDRLEFLGDRGKKDKSDNPASGETNDGKETSVDFVGAGISKDKRGLSLRKGIGSGRTQQQYRQLPLAVSPSVFNPETYGAIGARQKAIEALGFHIMAAKMHSNPKLMESGLKEIERHSRLHFTSPEGARMHVKHMKDTFGLQEKPPLPGQAKPQEITPEDSYNAMHKYIMGYNPKKHFNVDQAEIVRHILVHGKDPSGQPFDEGHLAHILGSGKIHSPHSDTFKDPASVAKDAIAIGSKPVVHSDEEHRAFKVSRDSFRDTTSHIADPVLRQKAMARLTREILPDIKVQRSERLAREKGPEVKPEEDPSRDYEF